MRSRMLAAAERPVIVVGNGARPFRDAVLALAERIDAPVITTFKAKGLVADGHPLACGVLGRSGTPVGSAVMARATACSCSARRSRTTPASPPTSPPSRSTSTG